MQMGLDDRIPNDIADGSSLALGVGRSGSFYYVIRLIRGGALYMLDSSLDVK